MTLPRLLLISGVRPGAGHVGEIILGDLCRGYPGRNLCFFHLHHRGIHSLPLEDLGWLPTCNRSRRFETPYRPYPGPLGAAAAIVGSQVLFRRHIRSLVRAGVAFGRQQRVQKVWVVLESATSIAVGRRVARQLGVPLLAQVWDTVEYLLSGPFDPVVKRQLLNEFGRSVREAERVAVVSPQMAKEYEERYSAKTVVVHHGLPSTMCRPAASEPVRRDRWTIGFAGSMNAPSAWRALLQGLHHSGWRVNERAVVLRILGSSLRLEASNAVHVEYLGHRSVEDTAAALAECDVNYLPHPFEPAMAPFSRLSFPTKLSTYAAAGRPILLHAPEYSSLVPFHERFPVGGLVRTLEPGRLVAAMESLAASETTYAHAAATVAAVTGTYNLENFRHAFVQFASADGHQDGVRTAVERPAG